MQELSIVIPAYNEELRIGNTLRQIVAYVQDRFVYEIVVVDDGSTDGTVAVVKGISGNIRVVQSPGNHGKGDAVRRGLLEASYPLVLFCDSDLATPIESVEQFVAGIAAGASVVIASRNSQGAVKKVKQPFYRQTLGRIFPLVVRVGIIGGFSDTQCGFKMFTRDAAREIAQRMTIDRFAFDVEQLVIAKRLGYAVRELPVVWTDQDGTTVRAVHDGSKMLMDLWKIRWQLSRGKYDQGVSSRHTDSLRTKDDGTR